MKINYNLWLIWLVRSSSASLCNLSCICSAWNQIRYYSIINAKAFQLTVANHQLLGLNITRCSRDMLLAGEITCKCRWPTVLNGGRWNPSSKSFKSPPCSWITFLPSFINLSTKKTHHTELCSYIFGFTYLQSPLWSGVFKLFTFSMCSLGIDK